MHSSHYSQFNEYEQLQSEKSMSRIIVTLLMVRGMISSTVQTLAVIPAIYALVKEWPLR
jgi:Cu/Ag efflux pump CusA